VALAGLPNAIRVFSHTQFGLSFTVVTYNDNADVNIARQQVNERLRGVQLPPGVEAHIAPNATPVGEIMRYRLRGDGKTTTELRTLEDWVVERALRQVPGVADVVAMGGYIKQYEVQPDLEKLRAHKLTFQNLLDALGRGNANAGGSYVAQGLQQFAIRGIGLLRSPEEIGQVVVATRNATPILVRDVAEVRIGAVPRLGTVGQDMDNDVVTGIVVMRKGENPSVVLKGVKDKIRELNERGLPAGVAGGAVLRPHLADGQDAVDGVSQPGRRRAAGVAGALHLPVQPARQPGRGGRDPAGAAVDLHGPEDHGRAGQPLEPGGDGFRC